MPDWATTILTPTGRNKLLPMNPEGHQVHSGRAEALVLRWYPSAVRNGPLGKLRIVTPHTSKRVPIDHKTLQCPSSRIGTSEAASAQSRRSPLATVIP